MLVLLRLFALFYLLLRPSNAQSNTTTKTISTSTTGGFGACSVPILEFPEEDPLIVTKRVTSTSVVLTNRINTLTVAAPFYTETSSVIIRDTFTSTVLELSSITTTTTLTIPEFLTSTITRTIIDDAINFDVVTGVTTIGPFERTSTRVSTVIFTSYDLVTQTRSFTIVSRTTSFGAVTSTQVEYLRTTDIEVSSIFLTFFTTVSVFQSFIIITTRPPTQTAFSLTTTFLTTLTRTFQTTTSFATETVGASTELSFTRLPFTLFYTRPFTFEGVVTGTITFNTPVESTFIS